MDMNDRAVEEGLDRIVYLAPGEGRKFEHYGDIPLLLMDAELTGGKFDLFVWEAPPGMGPPAHIHHREDEIFYILDGEMTAEVGGRRFVLKPGSFVCMPKGVPHVYKVTSNEPCRCIAIMAPSGFADFCRDVHEIAKDGREFNMEDVMPIVQKHQIEITGPPMA